jgi:hypothetical protein
MNDRPEWRHLRNVSNLRLAELRREQIQFWERLRGQIKEGRNYSGPLIFLIFILPR